MALPEEESHVEEEQDSAAELQDTAIASTEKR